MKLTFDEGVPLYLQIADLVKRQILAGKYKSGDRLPAVRELAVELRVNPNTVARAYALLQEEKVLEGRHGGGSYVTQPERQAHRMSRQVVAEEMERAVASARRFHLPPEEIRELFEKILNDQPME